jgi:hypothetical protein
MYQKLLTHLHKACFAYSTITNWRIALEYGEDISIGTSDSDRCFDETIDVLISEALHIVPFHSMHSLASIIKQSSTIMWNHLHSMGLVMMNLHFVPHSLSAAQKRESVKQSMALKSIL